MWQPVKRELKDLPRNMPFLRNLFRTFHTCQFLFFYQFICLLKRPLFFLLSLVDKKFKTSKFLLFPQLFFLKLVDNFGGRFFQLQEIHFSQRIYLEMVNFSFQQAFHYFFFGLFLRLFGLLLVPVRIHVPDGEIDLGLPWRGRFIHRLYFLKIPHYLQILDVLCSFFDFGLIGDNVNTSMLGTRERVALSHSEGEIELGVPAILECRYFGFSSVG